ncbi:protein-(glutamine-N5) methyltransferase, release factor-specific [Xaviernesmea oryzae]|uniref:Release factor glutamine methyltransferase n=1 Tax=Xaviernesmea oryzae TaxID=464029 RepID=A0A1Q9B2C9_9HYPH|nr:peptide chain release factor N(5)-glutamine methyltransferase [Xaviernesmea oryzae]OLP62164.1 protein-(glutamine-N5) methyltransferase, release factor-specific [Xaviernesmea oryzae]SEL89512.1 release factor glutamine methyltransferase [Xaviernesmea oryzae]
MSVDRLDALLVEARLALSQAGIDEPASEARRLVGECLGLSPVTLVTQGTTPVDAEAAARLRMAIARRAGGMPLHRILGRREFYGLSLSLSPETLEPRPDTEVLVDHLLPRARAIAQRRGTCRVIDLGTGTGAILLALLSEIPEAQGLATDISDEALATATHNAQANGLEGRFETVKSDWWEKISGQYDVIVSNPPYIVSSVMERLERNVLDYDPWRALDGGPDGLDAYRKLAEGADAHLKDEGIVGVEIGYDQKIAVIELFCAQGFQVLEAVSDLGGRDRALIFAR